MIYEEQTLPIIVVVLGEVSQKDGAYTATAFRDNGLIESMFNPIPTNSYQLFGTSPKCS